MSAYDDTYSDGYFAFDERLSSLSGLISSIDRPGDYCVYGRFHTPMPRISSETTGILAFPLQPAQLKDLLALGERAPYGRGEETILDRSVRDCWQLSPEKFSVGGAVWKETFGQILSCAAEGLGYPVDALEAELYKFLIYEEGGFFSAHRDTEKANGMVATLVVALPVAGSGGELVVRHLDRETVVDIRSEDPSELVHAAFYADCEHEIRPVTKGHRACLVYNLVLASDWELETSAPDYAHKVEPIAREIKCHFAASDAPEKLVWLLEHDYSVAGLAFANLKSVDAAVARVLISAAKEADCALHAAIVHIEEIASAEYYGSDYVDEIEDIREDEYEDYGIIDRSCNLDDWVHPVSGSVDYEPLKLAKNELMPAGRINDWAPDESRLTEASGNAGAEVERLYRNAALVMWPAKKHLRILARAGPRALSVLLAQASDRAAASGETDPPLEAVALEIAQAWPLPSPYGHQEEWEQSSAASLSRLCAIGNTRATEMFLDRIVMPHYGSGFNAPLVKVIASSAIKDWQDRLLRIVSTHFVEKPEAVVDLLQSMSETFDRESGILAQIGLDVLIGRIFSLFPAMAEQRPEKWSWEPRQRVSKTPLPEQTLRQFFQLAWRFDLEGRLGVLVKTIANLPAIAPPDRTVPTVLFELGKTHAALARTSESFLRLWRYSSDILLMRSGTPPLEPVDWVISSEGLDDGSEYGAEFVRFCADPEATTHRFSVRQQIRSELRFMIKSAGADISCETERKGRPYTLVCTKTRDSYGRRLLQYADDIIEIKRLLDVADTVPTLDSETIAALRTAVARGEGHDS